MNNPKQKTIALIGCGKMGSALLDGWLDSFHDADFLVIDPSGIPIGYEDNLRISHLSQADTSIRECAAIVLAVKPQIMEPVCRDIAELGLNAQTLVISIAAGLTLDFYSGLFGANQPLVRCMPNTPAAIGKGVSIAVPNSAISKEQKDLAAALLSVSGHFEWLEDEALINAVTALSGSGPAYVFYLIEALAKAGEESGLEASFAMRLARQTVIGSAALAKAEANTPASALRENVTSPGGTTEAALKVLMDGTWQETLNKALAANITRSRELSKE